MNTYKVTFQIKWTNLLHKVKITCIQVVVEAATESDSKIIAMELLSDAARTNIKSTQIQQL